MTDQPTAVEQLTGMRERQLGALPAIQRFFENQPERALNMMTISDTRLTDILDTVREPLEALGWTLTTEAVDQQDIDVFPTLQLALYRYRPPEPMELVAAIYCGYANDPDVRNAAVTYIQQLEHACRGNSRLAIGPRGFFIETSDDTHYFVGVDCWDTGA